MLPEPELDVVRLALDPDEIPVTTWSPGCTPLTTTVSVPSLMPVWTGTRTGLPLRSTMTALPWPPAYDSAELGTSVALSTSWVTMLTVAVMLGSRVTSEIDEGSTETRRCEVTRLGGGVPLGWLLASVP